MQLAKKLLEVQEEERKRLSRLLHDEFAQILSVAKFNLVWIRKELEKQIVGSSAEGSAGKGPGNGNSNR